MQPVWAGLFKYMIPIELLCPCSFPGIAEGKEPSQNVNTISSSSASS
jgi:hypothetical protein